MCFVLREVEKLRSTVVATIIGREAKNNNCGLKSRRNTRRFLNGFQESCHYGTSSDDEVVKTSQLKNVQVAGCPAIHRSTLLTAGLLLTYNDAGVTARGEGPMDPARFRAIIPSIVWIEWSCTNIRMNFLPSVKKYSNNTLGVLGSGP